MSRSGQPQESSEHVQSSGTARRSLRHVQVRTVTEVRLVKSGQPQESSACPGQGQSQESGMSRSGQPRDSSKVDVEYGLASGHCLLLSI